MAPFIALMLSFLLLWGMGSLGWSYFDDWHAALQGAVAVMFLLTASAHWGKRRPDLIRMVPPAFPRPASVVTITGYLEIAGAIGILIPMLSLAASIGLLLMLIAMFPANVFASRKKLTIDGRPVPRLAVRIVLQLVFIGAVVLASPWFGD
ncbi:DoxX family protein [Paenibacillus sp. LjRoot153]|uniref:DoxX family protein n=1 Tax=Paenibacillus sp. LjRoot153 TaxID=3342270 RepID=UPI003ECEBDFF